ncbi:MAG: hypothetical protein V8R75_15015 [Oscillospiraceae bacterium]
MHSFVKSGNEAAVCAYLVEFAKAHGLEYQTDDAHNIIMRRSAGKGFEGQSRRDFAGTYGYGLREKRGRGARLCKRPYFL